MTTISTNPVAQLKASTTATRVTFHWLGVSCKMEEDQKEQMASVVEADCDSLAVSKKLYNRKLEVIKDITKVRGKIKDYWERVTLPYVEPGIRLLKRASLTAFHEKMTEYQEELHSAAHEVQTQRDAILADARRRLQRAFNEGNYPDDLSTLFGVEWSFPSIDPPNYLAQMNPAIFEQERQRAAARLEEAVALAEQAFLQEFRGLVVNLNERLTPGPDGQRKVFRDSAVDNFHEFFERFRSLSVNSNADLDALVNQAQELLHGIQPNELRHGNVLRNDVIAGLSALNDQLAPLIVPKQRRNIIRPKKEETLEPACSA